MALHTFSWALRASVVLFATMGQPVTARQVAGDPPAAVCELSLQPVDQSWKGVCGPVFSNKEPTTLTARKVASLPGGSGRGDAAPNLMLVAKLTGRPETSALEVEFYGKDGVIRSQVGWRLITVTSESATTLHFRVADTEPDPTDLDRRIIERAAEILATEAVWDRADDRKCAPEDKTWSLYCALYRASLELTGGFHHRRPCLQIVRQILYERVAEERKKGRKYPHIMMDYNNDPTMRLADIQSVFSEAVARMTLRSAAFSFAAGLRNHASAGARAYDRAEWRLRRHRSLRRPRYAAPSTNQGRKPSWHPAKLICSLSAFDPHM